jgi:hypothetical protein
MKQLAGVSGIITAVIEEKAHRGTVYIAPNLLIRVTRKLAQGKIPSRGPYEFVVSLCQPNYIERKFVKACQKAGEKFPIKKIQLKFPPKRRKK